MAVTYAITRAALRSDLSDAAGPTQRWSDADLDRAADRALSEIDQGIPRHVTTVLATTAGSRVLSLGALGTYLSVVRLHFPAATAGGAAYHGAEPYRLDEDANTVTFVGPLVPVTGDVARVTAHVAYAIAAASGTLPDQWRDLLVLGASGHAMLAYSTPLADNFRYSEGSDGTTVDDTAAPDEWRARGQAALASFRRQLAAAAPRHSGSSRARTRIAV